MALTPAGMRPLIEALEEPAMLVERGLVRMANAAARQLLGDSIEGRDVRLAIRHPQALEQILFERAGDFEIRGIGQAGRPWTMSVRDLAEGSLLVRLIDRTAATAAERMRVDFVANASHELRTPLSTILGYAETLADDAEVERDLVAKFGSVIRGEASRMVRIIEDLMSLSRIQADRFARPTEELLVQDILSTAIENVRVVAEPRNVLIEAEIDKALPPVAGDYAQLLQLFDNLLTNAVRYGCNESSCAVSVGAALDKSVIRIVIADRGDGIAPEHLPRVTERFYRVDEARSRDSGGTGLGLAIAKHIVERHRGSLNIRSAPGEGTRVEVVLPLGRPAAPVTQL